MRHHGGRVSFGWPTALLSALLACACATPLEQLQDRAEARGFARQHVQGGGFTLLAYYRTGRGPSTTRRLHVYIEGDGIPWLRPDLPSLDPTPRAALMFEAMALDEAPSLYLGRPCYFVGTHEPPCTPMLWTHQRYSARVLDSMEGALRGFLATQRFDHLVFIGHSGGGTLATLLAPRFKRSIALVTVAANLDLDAWTRRHGYSPLEGSLDPASQPPLPASIRQWHLAGSDDAQVPPGLVSRYARSNALGAYRVYPGQAHNCCWLELWPQVLAEVNEAINRD